MPIARINDDGTVKIVNSNTGQVLDVKPDELPKYNPKLMQDYLSMTKEKNPVDELATLKAQEELKTLKSGEPKPYEPTAEQKFKRESALNAISRLEQTYGRGDNANAGTDQGLALSPSANTPGKLIGKTKAATKALFDPKFQEDLNIYTSALENAKGIFTQAFGSGTPQAFESESLLKNAPNAESTPREVSEWFKTVRSFLGQTEDIKKQTTGNTDTAKTALNMEGVVSPLGGSPDIKKNSIDNPSDTIKSITSLAPLAGAVVGGIGGGIAGGGLGAVPGAAIGGAAGESLKQYADGATAGDVARGMASLTPPGQLLNKISDPSIAAKAIEGEAQNSAVAEIAGQGIGKFVLQPIVKGIGKVGGMVLKSLNKEIADIPLKSIRVNPSQITKFAEKHGDLAKFMVDHGFLGEDALEHAAKNASQLQSEFDNLALNKNIQIPADMLKKRFSEEITKLAGRTDGTTRVVPGVAKDVAKNILNEWDNISTQLEKQGRNTVTPEELTLFRRTIDNLIPDSQFIDPNVKNIGIRLRKILNDTISSGIESRMIGEGEKGFLKQTGVELSKLYDFMEIAEKQSGLGKGNLVLNIPRLLLGATGVVATGSPFGAIAGMAADPLMRNPNVLKGIYEAGKAGQKVGEKALPILNNAYGGIPAASAALSQMGYRANQ